MKVLVLFPHLSSAISRFLVSLPTILPQVLVQVALNSWRGSRTFGGISGWLITGHTRARMTRKRIVVCMSQRVQAWYNSV